MLLAIIVVVAMIYGVNRLFRFVVRFVDKNKSKWLKNLKYRDYTFLSEEQEVKLIAKLFNIVRWLTILLLLFLVIPVIFSIFPFTRGWPMCCLVCCGRP